MSDELLRVDIPGTPRPQGKLQTFVRGGHAVGRYPEHVVEHRATVVSLLHYTWAGREPYAGSVYLRCLFNFARPKSHYGTGRNAAVLKAAAPTLHTQMPDIDKLVRLVCDALTGAGVIGDDSQVTALYAAKSWAETPMTRIWLHGWDGGLDDYL